MAIGLILVWVVTGPIFDFSNTWQLVINTGTTIITFLMVFLIQNTQNRDTEAIQVKLDELIRATRGAHNALMDLEELEEGNLDEYRQEIPGPGRRGAQRDRMRPRGHRHPARAPPSPLQAATPFRPGALPRRTRTNYLRTKCAFAAGLHSRYISSSLQRGPLVGNEENSHRDRAAHHNIPPGGYGPAGVWPSGSPRRAAIIKEFRDVRYDPDHPAWFCGCSAWCRRTPSAASSTSFWSSRW